MPTTNRVKELFRKSNELYKKDKDKYDLEVLYSELMKQKSFVQKIININKYVVTVESSKGNIYNCKYRPYLSINDSTDAVYCDVVYFNNKYYVVNFNKPIEDEVLSLEESNKEFKSLGGDY